MQMSHFWGGSAFFVLCKKNVLTEYEQISYMIKLHFLYCMYNLCLYFVYLEYTVH